MTKIVVKKAGKYLQTGTLKAVSVEAGGVADVPSWNATSLVTGKQATIYKAPETKPVKPAKKPTRPQTPKQSKYETKDLPVSFVKEKKTSG